jgi:hypothetical protein
MAIERAIPEEEPIPATPPSDTSQPYVTRTPPCGYCVLRAGQTTPERFNAFSDEDAIARLQKEVRTSQTPIVYLYKLLLAEQFQSSSYTLDRSSLEDILPKRPTTPVETLVVDEVIYSGK